MLVYDKYGTKLKAHMIKRSVHDETVNAISKLHSEELEGVQRRHNILLGLCVSSFIIILYLSYLVGTA